MSLEVAAYSAPSSLSELLKAPSLGLRLIILVGRGEKVIFPNPAGVVLERVAGDCFARSDLPQSPVRAIFQGASFRQFGGGGVTNRSIGPEGHAKHRRC